MVCESTVKGAYWSVEGIQCNGYDEWVQMAEDADYNYVWAPLDRAGVFDSRKANAYIDSVLGYHYGYQIMLMGWIDSVKNNFPCRYEVAV